MGIILDGKPLDSAPVDVSTANLAAVAKQWHRTEEFQLDRWSEGEVLEVLGEFRQLASAAKAGNKSVLLFLSL